MEFLAAAKDEDVWSSLLSPAEYRSSCGSVISPAFCLIFSCLRQYAWSGQCNLSAARK